MIDFSQEELEELDNMIDRERDWLLSSDALREARFEGEEKELEQRKEIVSRLLSKVNSEMHLLYKLSKKFEAEGESQN